MRSKTRIKTLKTIKNTFAWSFYGMFKCLKLLTHYIAVKQPSFTRSKWNMGEIYELKFYLLYEHISQKKLLKSLPGH